MDSWHGVLHRSRTCVDSLPGAELSFANAGFFLRTVSQRAAGIVVLVLAGVR